MPERTSKLKETLAELEAELSQLDSLDDEARAHLSQVAQEIVARLSSSKPQTAAKVDAGSLRERAETFEAEHPHLSSIIFRIVDLLGQAGI